MPSDSKTVSAIMPVFNEEKTVAKVIEALLCSGLVSEIICVNDASTDNSLEVLRGFGGRIKLINLKKNCGKGFAVVSGIKAAQGELLLFCDADLINFTSGHVRSMLTPVLEGNCQAVFAVPTRDPRGRYARTEVFLAGERVYPRKSILPHLSQMTRCKGAGASEVILNTLFTKKDIKIVPLIGLVKPSKEQKWSSTTAAKQYLASAVGVLQEVGRIEINSPADLKKLENLIQVDTFESLTDGINQVKKEKIKALLGQYFNRYSSYFKKLNKLVSDELNK